MTLADEPQAWQFYPADSFVSVTYEEELVGFCKPDFAVRIVDVLNDDEKLRKALRLACYDLISLSGGTTAQIDELMQKYLAKTAAPTTGVAAIALLLRDRQEELDVSDKEFVRFCDSYRLSKEKLEAIYAGEEIDGNLLVPLSRILGQPVEDILEILERGFEP
ncbi:MAG: hypothetical protein HC881_02540 [Leptolyngbyaceae cyanobacterium SL_7_1]|nr:hypothetical protein [Leptolyngbyaceae cyanobacterium SL_7_1]